MAKNFDLIAIGTGSAASAVAYKCRAAGWNVVVIDSRPFGGTCALRGCDPKKVLVAAAELMDWNQRMRRKGVSSNDAQIAWSDLMRFKRTFTDPVPQEREKSFAKAGIATFHGRAHFVGPTSIVVGDETLAGRYILIAAGAKPAKLGIPARNSSLPARCFWSLNTCPGKLSLLAAGTSPLSLRILPRVWGRKL